MSARPLFLVGNPRTGSTLLTTLLLQHPDIHMHGELFHPEESERRGAHALRGRAVSWFDPNRDDAIRFLDDEVFAVPTDYRGRPVNVVGVKVFADHVNTGGARDLFVRVHEHYPTAHILHMRRDDYLSVLVSLEFAQRSRQWVAWSHLQDPRGEVPPFSIPPAKARRFFEDMHRADAYFALHFTGPAYLPVHYEDLVEDLPATMAAVWSSLGVEAREVAPVTDKQVQDADRELVENLEQLRAEFSAFLEHHEIKPRSRNLSVAAQQPAADVEATTLRFAARGIPTEGIQGRLAAREIEASTDDIEAIVSSARASAATWRARALPVELAAALLVAIPVTVGREGQLEDRTVVVGIGITPDGQAPVLGVWPDATAVDTGARGLESVRLVLQDPELGPASTLDDAVSVETLDTATLGRVRDTLRDMPREDLRAEAAALGEELRESADLVALPEVLRNVVVAPLHLRNATGPYRGLGRVRSPFGSVDDAVEALSLLAMSTDPRADGRARWAPWRPRHTKLLAEAATASDASPAD